MFFKKNGKNGENGMLIDGMLPGDHDIISNLCGGVIPQPVKDSYARMLSAWQQIGSGPLAKECMGGIIAMLESHGALPGKTVSESKWDEVEYGTPVSVRDELNPNAEWCHGHFIEVIKGGLQDGNLKIAAFGDYDNIQTYDPDRVWQVEGESAKRIMARSPAPPKERDPATTPPPPVPPAGDDESGAIENPELEALTRSIENGTAEVPPNPWENVSPQTKVYVNVVDEEGVSHTKDGRFLKSPGGKLFGKLWVQVEGVHEGKRYGVFDAKDVTIAPADLSPDEDEAQSDDEPVNEAEVSLAEM